MKYLLLSLSVFILIGCSSYIEPHNLKKAKEICEEKGGVYHIKTITFLGGIPFHNVKCYDGETVESID